LNAPHEDTDEDLAMAPPVHPASVRFGAFLAVLLLIELVWALTSRAESGAFPGAAISSAAALGQLLFTTYAFQFEVTSILILVAMVGAVVLARRDPTAPIRKP
jgi:NADH-quinone oxidoreductase subunit J